MAVRIEKPALVRVRCPYCTEYQSVECWEPTEHEVLVRCYVGICLRTFVVRFVCFITGQVVPLKDEDAIDYKRDPVTGERKEQFDDEPEPPERDAEGREIPDVRGLPAAKIVAVG